MNIKKTTLFTLLILSIALLAIRLFFSLQGVYYLGDTVSHFEYERLATNPLMAFIVHPREWPPFLALALYFGGLIIIDNHILMLLLSASALIASWLTVVIFSKKLSWPLVQTVAIASIILLIPRDGIVMGSFISETFLILFWLLSSLFLYLFFTQKKETWLVLFMLIASLVPLSRFLGAVVLVWFCILILSSLGVSILKKSRTPYSKWFTLFSTGVIWIPIAFFLFRTKIMIGSFFGEHDMKYDFNLSSTLSTYANMIIGDIGVVALVSFLTGFTFPKIKTTMTALLITAGSAIFYFLGLLNVERVYAIYDHLPSRFLVVMYPSILLAIVCLGVYFKDFIFSKIVVTKRLNEYIKQGSFIALVFLLGFSLFNQIKHFLLEKENYQSQVEGVLWTGDMRSLCRNYQINAIVLHENSRNWGLRSFPLVCKQDVRVIDLNSQSSFVNFDEGIASGYKIDLPQLVENESMILDGYPTYVYTVKEGLELPLEKIFENKAKFQ